MLKVSSEKAALIWIVSGRCVQRNSTLEEHSDTVGHCVIDTVLTVIIVRYPCIVLDDWSNICNNIDKVYNPSTAIQIY